MQIMTRLARLTLTELCDLLEKVEFKENTKVIWGGGGGDFNMIFNTALDADNTPSLKTNTLKKVYSIMEDHDLCDIFRIRNPHMQRTPLIQHRLDYFLISNELQEEVEHIDILPSVASDHSVVHLKFALSGQNSRGKSYWKFNNYLTEDTISVESMKVKIKEVMQEISETDDPRVSWEFLKYKMRQFARLLVVEKNE